MDKETPSQRRKRIEKRNLHRGTTCLGCRHNYYNFPKVADSVGVAVNADYSCWHLHLARREKCPQKS